MAARSNWVPASSTAAEAAAWEELAADLARWAWDRLAVRTDVWGGYRPLAERGREYTAPDGTRKKLGTPTTHPRLCDRSKVFLTHDVLERHFRGRCPEDVVGLHSTSPDNLCLAGAVDIDHHGPTSTSPEANLRAALHWYESAAGHGFHPLLTNSNGRGGFHLRLLFAEPVPSRRVFFLLKWLTRNHVALGFPKSPETFPKQPEVQPGQVGNWLRLPGRHHTREHWSAVYDGKGEWLEGAEAVAFILALGGDSPTPIPEAQQSPQPATPPAPRCFQGRARGQGGNLSARIAGRLARLPHGGEGSGRDDVAFGFAAWLVKDLALPDDIALAWLERWDAGNTPPKGRERLAEILSNAHQYGKNAVGCGLTPEPAAEARYVRPTGRPGHSTIKFTVEVR